METSDAKFKLTNARITRINNRERVAFVTVLCKTGKYADWIDLTVFEGGLGHWQEGDAVNVVGEIRKRKPREGSRVWETQLVAKQFSVGDDKLAPRPKKSGERQARNDKPDTTDYGDVDF